MTSLVGEGERDRDRETERQRDRERGEVQVFFVIFRIIRSYIFPENYIEIPQVVQKIFSSIFRIFDISV